MATPQVSDRGIAHTRVLNAPRELVWKAWTDPKHLARWWGPHGFTNTFEIFEPKPGGQWRFVMHGPNGANYPNESVFVELVKPERIVLDHVNHPKFRAIATFQDEGGRTKATFQQLFPTPAEFEALRTLVTRANEENFDRIEAELATMK